MKRRRVLFIRLSQFRLFLRKLVVTLVIISAFGFVVLSRADNVGLNKTEDLISRILNPVIRVIQLPADGIYFVYEKTKNIFRVYTDNELLRRDVEHMDYLKNKIYALKIENELLSEMLYYTPLPQSKFVTAKVIAVEGDGFSHSLIVYVPEKTDIRKGEVALYKGAVIGRVDAIHGAYVRVMLISDINSKIPVTIERSRDRAILSGNNTQILNLLYTSSAADIKKGDKVVTSGIGGVFPSELPIGYVSDISQNVVLVEPINPIEKIEYLKIVHYPVADKIWQEGTLK